MRGRDFDWRVTLRRVCQAEGMKWIYCSLTEETAEQNLERERLQRGHGDDRAVDCPVCPISRA